ncbi:MAG: DUF3568 family protein [Sulfuricella sp.]|nr:DUF3568 family protein [Sulfuricella sp.]
MLTACQIGQPAMLSPTSRILILAIGILPLAGCETVAISALGAGTSAGVSAGVSNTTAGTVSRTFTAPLPSVRTAALAALQRMQIEIRFTGKVKGGEVIKAKSVSRNIDIELEEISPNATRISVSAKSGVFPYDSATGAEILLQTGRAMGKSGE